MKDLEDHVKKLEIEYDCLNDVLAHGESNGFNTESAPYLAISWWLKISWMKPWLRWWNKASERMKKSTFVSPSQLKPISLCIAPVRTSRATAAEMKIRSEPHHCNSVT